MHALEVIGETWAGGVLAILTFTAGIAFAKRRLLQKVKRARR
jgi:hypothetical protein